MLNRDVFTVLRVAGMNLVGKRLLFLTIGSIVLCIGVTAIVSVVDFSPDGVPLARRAEYEAKIAEIKLREHVVGSSNGHLKPTATVHENTYDFGLLDPHSSSSHQFVVENTGAKHLLLESAGTTCKCTVSNVEGRVVRPGESTKVTVTWNAGYKDEEYEQSALIKTNDPVRPELKLTVRGKVRAELVLLSNELPMPSADIGKLASASTYLYSQLWRDFRIESASSELPGFQWSAEPLTNEELPASDLEARSAWRLKISTLGSQVGNFEGKVKLKIVPVSGGQAVERELVVAGRVRSLIAFADEELHPEKGLSLGIIPRGKEFNRSLIVRVRDGATRKIDVLDVQPKELQATLEPMNQPGAYKLTLRVPAESGVAMFDREDKHGYVQIGDKNDKSFHNWLPLYGAIINPPAIK